MSVDPRFGYDTSCYALDCNFRHFARREKKKKKRKEKEKEKKKKEKRKKKKKNAYRLAVSVGGVSFMHFR